jgi:hypothetical protein
VSDEILSGSALEEIIVDCLYREDEMLDVPEGQAPPGAVIVRGILNTFGFHPERLEKHRERIWAMLNELPEVFWAKDDEHPEGGGGMSFLQACDDRNGVQWTSFHRTMDQLFSLGQALGYVTCLLPREFWTKLPGGMPYYVLHDRRNAA